MMPPSNNLNASASRVPSRRAASGFPPSDFRLWTLDFGLWPKVIPLLLALTTLGASPSAPAPEQTPPTTPREFYNAGARQLRAGKLREAEASLESALASQNQRLQPPALYNLGLVRFGQGVEQLKKGPAAKPKKPSPATTCRKWSPRTCVAGARARS